MGERAGGRHRGGAARTVSVPVPLDALEAAEVPPVQGADDDAAESRKADENTEPFALARAPRSARVRVGVGAAVVLVIGALVVTVVVTALGAQGSTSELSRGAGDTSSTAGTGLTLTDSSGSASGGSGAGETDVLVHVLGAVASPGLVSLAPGSRVVDAVAAAGGLTGDADVSGINLARPVADGEQLSVPRAGEVVAAPSSAPGGGGGVISGALVNINTASESELATLPRIGPALAQRISDWRTANGRFATPADLMKVTGIGQKLFDGLKDRIAV